MDKANIYYPSVYALEEWTRAISWNCWSLCGESTPAVSLRMEMQYLNTGIRKQYVYKWGNGKVMVFLNACCSGPLR